MFWFQSHMFQVSLRRGCCNDYICTNKGQATIEAVFVIPLMFCLLLILMQPAILLYDHIVMGNAAAETCRLLATSGSSLADMSRAQDDFVRHRLASIPQHDCFHVHGNECSWDIGLTGDEASHTVTVSIKNKLKPLPLVDGALGVMGLLDSEGHLEIAKTVTMETQPEWVRSSVGESVPEEWVGAWM